MSAYESALIRMDPGGKVVVMTGTHSHGQAHETVFAQIAADELGVAFEDVKVVLGDTAVTPYGWGTWGSRAAVTGGGAVILAARKLRAKLARLAAHRLEVSPADIEIRNGVASVRGRPARSVRVSEIARATLFTEASRVPQGEDPGLEASHYFEPPPVTFPNATHVAVVDVDPETGGVEIVRYVVVEDCGKMINPMVVDGQIHGGVAQGIGGALLEHLVYDEGGQLSTVTLMDYLVPSAADVPVIEIGHIETPSPLVPGGFKGAGEGGAIAPPAALANAVSDALGGEAVTRLPLSPEYVRSLVAAAGH
jgi:carbon-monoxide dehydrogenase large subunit